MSDSRTTESLISRPLEQRRREYHYRLGQAAVFGVPVLFLQYFGAHLGGPEAQRWVAVFQAVLSGWITYVAAAGMLSDGVLRILAGRRAGADFVVAIVATLVFLHGAVATLGVLFIGRPFYGPLFFHLGVLLLIVWSGLRSVQLRAKCVEPAADAR